MKIITVVGARPQFVKAAVVSRALQQKKDICEIIVHTGQHYDENMSDIFFREMQIPLPAYNLAIQEKMHGAMTGKMMSGIENILIEQMPECVLVYGDTNSTMAAALAASKLHIPVAHVEAGLRSYNMKMPEEINRIVTDTVSTLLFCPTKTATDNLQAEGFDQPFYHTYLTGDVMYDAAMFYFKQSTSQIVKQNKLSRKPFILATIHRAENTNTPEQLESIVRALNTLHKDLHVIVPLHPRTAKLMDHLAVQPEFTILPPVGYFDMLQLLHDCKLVITDSGGLQKEAYFFHKRCVVMREQTEWVELLHHGFCALSGSNTNLIVQQAKKFLNEDCEEVDGLYGDGHAGNKIAEIIERFF